MNTSVDDLPEQLPFGTELTVRITDVNYGGHLGNDAVLSLLHEARLAFLDSYGHSETDCGGGVGLILREWQVRLSAQSHHGDRLRIDIGITDARRTGFDLGYRVTRVSDDRKIVEAVSEMVFFDYARQRPARRPADCRL